MKNIWALVLVAAVGLFGQSAFSEESPVVSTIKGTEIDLKAYDHAFAGVIKDFVAWGVLDEATGTSELRMRRDGQTVVAQFGKVASGFGGTVSHEQADGTSKTTKIEFVSLDMDAATYTFKVNGAEMLVKVTSDDFQNSHFINPTYNVVLDGKTIEFKFEGSACYNYSMHLIFMIAGAYFH